MQDDFKHHIAEFFPHLSNQKFLLASSGGIDSMVLTHLCANSRMDFSIAHCNFHLRGEASDGDEAFVRDFAKTLGREIYVTHFDTEFYAETHKVSIQIAARELRYQWFSEIMEKENIKTLVTAHHADDNLETFIINLSRGTGLEGLCGIPADTATISRPLLKFSRAQIVAYAKQHQIAWRDDASNEDTKYLRNNIRHNIVPSLKNLHPSFLDNFLKTQEHLQQSLEILQAHIQGLRQRVFKCESNHIKIAIADLLPLTPRKTYLFHFFKDYGFTQWEDIDELLSAMSGKEVHSPTHRLLKDRAYLLLKLKEQEDSQVFNIQEGQKEIKLPVSLRLEDVREIRAISANTVYLDKEKLNYPLVLRKWEKGDYFYPFGMKGKKKIAKYFKDQKIDMFAKENQWLLCSGADIVWVIGKRADDRFKVTGSTNRILKIDFIE